ncbi:ArsR/SmtB family transcription factor [Halorientalis marina]|jgi:DNA-binding transcriptional ArsR family regulator|uniref:ArsR/SmtB family transcription factor n=1 Tax=Halorientalis marina TaxID=2931976 RepID=UPI001FF5F9EE|nr:helix-turn-helix domain-containing protein [Halorientalis marina]
MGPPAERDEDDLQRLLDALGDPDCRRIVRELDDPMTAKELMDACDLSQTTTYRKLDRLSETALVAADTELREDGHHTTRYERAVEGVFVDLAGTAPDEADDITLVEDEESPDETLARLWSQVGEQL